MGKLFVKLLNLSISAGLLIFAGMCVFFFIKPEAGLYKGKPSLSEEGMRLYSELNGTSGTDSASVLLDCILKTYPYSSSEELNYDYVMPDGVEIEQHFTDDSLQYLREYIGKWPDFVRIENDESLLEPWIGDHLTENGYLVISFPERSSDGSQYGCRLYIKDGYVHLFCLDEFEYKYIWTGVFGNDFIPNMFSLRRILFDQKAYDTYVRYCSYDEIITTSGLYPVNRGYSTDLDGDGEMEKVFVAYCGWCGYAEPDNISDWTELEIHPLINMADKGLIYINGRLYTDDKYKGPQEDYDCPVFAVVDTDISDGRRELLLKRKINDVFYIWENGDLKIHGEYIGNLISFSADQTTPYSEYTLLARFNGDGTFDADGPVIMTECEFPAYLTNAKWRIAEDGIIQPVDGIYEVSHFDKDYVPEYLTGNDKLMESAYLRLVLELNADVDADTNEGGSFLEPGYYIFDKTDGVSLIHLMSVENDCAGWIDLKKLEKYVVEYESSGIKEAEESQKAKILFENLNNDPAN